MVDKKTTKKAVDVGQQLADLQKKLDKQDAEISRLKEENRAVAGLQPIQDRLMSEMDKLARKSKVDTGKTQVKIIDDHHNVYLYWKNGYHIGKRVGGLHPHNAKVEMGRFSRRGIILSIDPPTTEEIAAYKATDEYKRLAKEFERKRAKKIKTKRSGEIDRLAASIEKLSGQKVTNAIADQPV